MKQTLGRFLQQENRDFPADCEMLDYMQANLAIVSILGNIVGNKTILSGCVLESSRLRRGPGYVFLKTKDFPDGEVIYWEGGSIIGGMYLKQEAIKVTAQGYEYPQAYTVRSLAPGIGTENYNWSEFHTFKTPQELEDYDKTQDDKIAMLALPPLGIVQLWAGKTVPAGYELCEGQQLKISDYPELYAAIGNTYNAGRDYNGMQYQTTSGYFRLPDLRGRFIVGYSTRDTEYNSYGKVGGSKKHTLSVGEIPSHSHSLFLVNAGSRFTGGGSANELNSGNGTTGSAGGGQAHENRPPYYTLAYIMRVE